MSAASPTISTISGMAKWAKTKWAKLSDSNQHLIQQTSLTAAGTAISGAIAAGVSFGHHVNPYGLGEFRVPRSNINGIAVPDVLLGPLPIYNVEKYDFSDSDSDIKLRAQKSMFFGHQSGDTFAMTIHGRLAGDAIAPMITLLRSIKIMCGGKEVPANEVKPGIDTLMQHHSSSGLIIGPTVDERSVQMHDIGVAGSARNDKWASFVERQAISKFTEFTRFTFPVITKNAVFYNSYVETVNFSHVYKEDGVDTMTFSLFIRRFHAERKRHWGIIDVVAGKQRRRVAVSFYTKEHIPTFIKNAANLFTIGTITVQSIVAAINMVQRPSYSKLTTVSAASLVGGSHAGQVDIDAVPINMRISTDELHPWRYLKCMFQTNPSGFPRQRVVVVNSIAKAVVPLAWNLTTVKLGVKGMSNPDEVYDLGVTGRTLEFNGLARPRNGQFFTRLSPDVGRYLYTLPNNSNFPTAITFYVIDARFTDIAPHGTWDGIGAMLEEIGR